MFTFVFGHTFFYSSPTN